jgi:hypothetical protein
MVSGLRRCRKIARRHGIREVLPLVAPVTEGLVTGVAAAADRHGCASCETKRLSFLVDNFKITFHP